MMKGTGVSAGIGIGRALVVKEETQDYSGVLFSGAEQEQSRILAAVQVFEQQIQTLAETAGGRIGSEDAEILKNQLMVLQDPELIQQLKEKTGEGLCAEAALDEVCEMWIRIFSASGSEILAQRAADLRDIRTRMLVILLGRGQNIGELPPDTILIARELTPSMTVGLDLVHLAGLASDTGGMTSHCAILARAMEIPAVLGIQGISASVQDGEQVILDGSQGVVICSPDEKTLELYRIKQEKEQQVRSEMMKLCRGPAVDADGKRHPVCANIGSVQEAESAMKKGAEGIGLFRTEFLFLGRSLPPDEEEQTEVYMAAAKAANGKPVTIRTLDVGGDKDAPCLHMEQEENPALGCRAIRYCLAHPDIFKVQLRALLRTGAVYPNIRIMLPLITGLEELHTVKNLLHKAENQLAEENIPYAERIPLGVMIETPAAALCADLFAAEADFFSIGTNDLVQYTLAADRGNIAAEKLNTPYHPAVLRSIKQIMQAAHTAHIPVAMCGEAAADPALLPVWLAFGLDEFSMSPSMIPAIRSVMAKTGMKDAVRIAKTVSGMTEAKEIEEYLKMQTE